MDKRKGYCRFKTRDSETSSDEDFNSDAGTLKPLVPFNPSDPYILSILPISSYPEEYKEKSSLLSFSKEVPVKKVHKKKKLGSRPLKYISNYFKLNQHVKRKMEDRRGYSRIKTRNYNTSSDDSDAGTHKPLVPLKANCPSDQDTSNILPISSFSEEHGDISNYLLPSFSEEQPAKKVHKKRQLVSRPLKYMSTYLKRNQPVKRSNSMFSLFSELAAKGSELSGRRTLQGYQKFNVKCKKVSQCVSEVQSASAKKKLTSSQVLSETLNETITLSSYINEPQSSSIYEHSLNIEEPLVKKEFSDSSNKSNLINLSDTVIFLDNSPVPASYKTGISHVVSAEKFTMEEFQSSSPISIHHSSIQVMHLPIVKSEAEVKEITVSTSTPPVDDKRAHSPYFNPSDWKPNVLSSSTNITQLSSTSKNCSNLSFTSDYGLGNKLDYKMIYSVKSNLTTSQHQSCELLPTFYESGLNDISTKRNFHSLNKDNLGCLDSCESNLLKLLDLCDQDCVIGFEDVFDWSHTGARKIGEGTCCEVFLITQKKSSSVIKVIPFLDVNTLVPGMQPIETVFSELKVAHCLSKLRTGKDNQTKNFNKLKSAKIVRGTYPGKMLVAWDTFSEAKTTDNLRPDVFVEKQLFAILELEYGGKDLTAFVMRNAAEAECIFKQVAISLAIAEEVYLFEHRDLHLGNILVKRNDSKTISYILRGIPFSIRNDGLVVTIIDFAFSRVLESGSICYNNLAKDESLFNHNGDYQYDVYRIIRNSIHNEWQRFYPHSNVLWLSMLCAKLLKSEYSRPTSKKHMESMEHLLDMIKEYGKNMEAYESSFVVFQRLQIVDFIPNRSQL